MHLHLGINLNNGSFATIGDCQVFKFVKAKFHPEKHLMVKDILQGFLKKKLGSDPPRATICRQTNSTSKPNNKRNGLTPFCLDAD
ncbi:MAG: hypothetical protein ACE5KD_03675 [Candidatus Bathyarchaeia archaeon]